MTIMRYVKVYVNPTRKAGGTFLSGRVSPSIPFVNFVDKRVKD